MNCEETGAMLDLSLEHTDPGIRRQLTEHLASCDDCQFALRAREALQAERDTVLQPPRAEAFSRAMLVARNAQSTLERWNGSFWTGLAIGASTAAIVAILVSSVFSSSQITGAVPEVALTLQKPADVSIAIDVPEALRNAEIRVFMRGAVDLYGYEGQRDIHWVTDLEKGINALTLPVVAIGESGGQLRVEVHHERKRKTFLVDVHASVGDDAV